MGIGDKGVTADGLFSLEEVECIGACCWAPAIQVNYDFHDELSAGHVPGILAGYRGKRGSRRRLSEGKACEGLMPRLVSHPDEVKIVLGALGRARRRSSATSNSAATQSARKCLEQGPDWIINEMKASELTRTRRRGIPDRA